MLNTNGGAGLLLHFEQLHGQHQQRQGKRLRRPAQPVVALVRHPRLDCYYTTTQLYPRHLLIITAVISMSDSVVSSGEMSGVMVMHAMAAAVPLRCHSGSVAVTAAGRRCPIGCG